MPHSRSRGGFLPAICRIMNTCVEGVRPLKLRSIEDEDEGRGWIRATLGRDTNGRSQHSSWDELRINRIACQTQLLFWGGHLNRSLRDRSIARFALERLCRNTSKGFRISQQKLVNYTARLIRVYAVRILHIQAQRTYN